MRLKDIADLYDGFFLRIPSGTSYLMRVMGIIIYYQMFSHY